MKKVSCVIAVVFALSFLLISCSQQAPSADSISADSRIKSIMTFSEYEGGPVGCDFQVFGLDSKTDSELLSLGQNLTSALPSKIMGDDTAPMARIEFDAEHAPTSVVASAHGPDSAANEFDISLAAEKHDLNSHIVYLPNEDGDYILRVEVAWDDGAKDVIVFVSSVTT